MRILVILVFSLSSIQFLNAQILNNQLGIDLETPHNWSKSKVDSDMKVYTAPPGYYVLSAQKIVHSKNGHGSSGVTTSQPNASLISIEEVRRSFDNQRNYVLNLDVSDAIKADLIASIDEHQESYEKQYFQLASSHSVVIHKAEVRGQGVASFKGRSWYRGSVRIQLVGSGPEFEQIPSFRNKADVDFRSMLQERNIKVNNVATLKHATIGKNTPARINKIQKSSPLKMKKKN